MLVCLLVIACSSKVLIDLSRMVTVTSRAPPTPSCSAPRCGTRTSSLWLLVHFKWQVEFSPAAPTRPTKYNCWAQLTGRTHRTPRLEKATRRQNGSQASLLGTKQGPLGSPTSSQGFSFIYHDQSKMGRRWQVKGWVVDSVESLAASCVDPPEPFPNTSGESKSIYTFI